MNYKHLVNNEWVSVDESELIDGERIQKEVVSGVWAEMNYLKPAIEVPKTFYGIDSLSVINDVLPAEISLSGDYSVDISVDVTISCNITGGVAIDYTGHVIKIPLVRFADDGATDDEIYFTATILAGVFSATGRIPRSGDWRLLSTRINKALDRINAGWGITDNEIGLLA